MKQHSGGLVSIKTRILGAPYDMQISLFKHKVAVCFSFGQMDEMKLAKCCAVQENTPPVA